MATFSSIARAQSTGPSPRLTGAMPSMRHYRRSVTTKAPRKRTFLASMEKFDAARVAPAGIASNGSGSGSASTLGGAFSPISCIGGGDNGRIGGNDGRGGNNGRGDGAGGDHGHGLPSRLGNALLGAIALTAFVAAFPAQSRAMLGSPSTSPASQGDLLSNGTAASGSPPRGRSKVIHVTSRDSTLVIPLPAQQDHQARTVGALAGTGRVRIVDAPIELTRDEVSLVADRQYRVRESMRVN